MDARASERGGRLARRNVASVLADVFGRVDVGVDARRRDGDADRDGDGGVYDHLWTIAVSGSRRRHIGPHSALGEGDAIAVSDDVACGTMGCGGL